MHIRISHAITSKDMHSAYVEVVFPLYILESVSLISLTRQ